MERRALDEFIERTRGIRRRAELDNAAATVFRAFDQAGVQSLLLKGPVLARLLYLEEEIRSYSDIDVIVQPAHLDRARGILEALGYKKGDDFGVDDVAEIQSAELWAAVVEASSLWIDLHWRLDGCGASSEEVWASLAAGQRSVEVSGQEVPVPGLPGLALHIALHAAQHGPEDLKVMGDLRRALDRWPAEIWRSAKDLASDTGATAAFSAGLRLDPGGARLAADLGLPTAPDVEWEIRHRGDRPRGTFHLRALSGAHTWQERVGLLRRSLIPTAQWIRWEFPWAARSRPRLIAAYAYHVARSPLWAFSALRYVRSARRAGRASRGR